MAKKKRSPSRIRYERANPTVSGRVPASYKERLKSLLEKAGLSYSAWLKSKIDGQSDTVVEVDKVYEEGLRRGYVAGTMETMLAIELSDDHRRVWDEVWRDGGFDKHLWETYVMDVAEGDQRVEELCRRSN